MEHHAFDNRARRAVRDNNAAIKAREDQIREDKIAALMDDIDQSFARVFSDTFVDEESDNDTV